MSDLSTTDFITLDSATFTDSNTVTFTEATNTTDYPGTVVDADNSDSASMGDYWIYNGFTYTGYTINVDGVDYAVYSYVYTDSYYIPHNGELSPEDFTSGMDVVYDTDAAVANCFLTDTRIATPEGDVAVQDLNVGDVIRTAEGRDVAVKWVGRQTVATRFGAAERLLPVRFAAGSLGNGLPLADLTVTADHGMLVDGVICHAGALVNGTTIAQVPMAELGADYTVYHVETEAHEIILANGATAESFIDNVSRKVFDNYAEFEALYGDAPEMVELPLPRALSARQVPASIKARLAAKIAA
ncbi:Hint domain-containing protein [Marinibacterium sp. SX1]|uniref:Hint domain-containing protein n=1 Tax=Marinibacterium sp. SX1 TaxID=3388424 RepID=UPI003D186341